jgi:hypothetical protein
MVLKNASEVCAALNILVRAKFHQLCVVLLQSFQIRYATLHRAEFKLLFCGFST